MSNRKIKDRYFIPCKGVKIEVPEEVYRAWVYYYNMELTSTKLFYNRKKKNKDGTVEYLPSRNVYLDASNLSDRLHNKKDNPEYEYLHNEIHRLLSDAISQLDSDRQRVITLLFYYRMSETEIAGILGKSQSTVSNYKHQALKILCSILDEGPYSRAELLEMISE